MLKSYRLKRAAKRAIRELESSLRQLDQIAPESGDEIRMLIGEAQIRSQRISELLGEIRGLDTAIRLFEVDDPRREGMVIQRNSLEAQLRELTAKR